MGNERYEIIIKPNRNWFYIDWAGFLHYRDLLFLLVRRDFVARYTQTILGPLWFIIQPLITTVVFTIFFNRIAKIPTDGLPPMLFYLCGLLVWNYFANSLERTSLSFIDNSQLFGKVYFPRLIVPLSNLISNLFAFGIQLAAFLAFYFYFKFFTVAGAYIKPNVYIFALPLLVIQTAAFSLGVGLWMAALTAKYRDLSFLMGFLIQLWMYATPVIYPVSAIPGRWRFILALNPVAAIMDLYRCAFFGTAYLSYKYLLISVLVTIFVLLSGIFAFNRAERTAIDTL